MFRALLDGTYRSVFGSGLQLLDATVREVVAEVLADWQVKHMVAVSHETLQQRLIAIRQAIDARLQSTLPRLFIRKYTENTEMVEGCRRRTFANQAMCVDWVSWRRCWGWQRRGNCQVRRA